MPPPDGTSVATHPVAKNFAADPQPMMPLARILPAAGDHLPAGFERVKSHVVPVPIVPSTSHALLRTLGINAAATKTLVAGIAYCSASVSMVLLNKIALSQYPLQSPTALLALQCTLCMVLVVVLRALHMVHTQPLSWPIVKLWLPCNAIFVLMLFSR